MDTVKLAERVVETKTAHLYRYRNGQMQAREYGQGRKRGWILLDLFSASAILSVAKAINPNNLSRLAKLPPDRAARICLDLCRR